MSDRDAFNTVSTEIAEWQIAAQRLPLADLFVMVTTWQNGLASSLDGFNDAYLSHDDGDEPSTQIMQAIGEVTRRATALAIFTLGIALRAQMTARQN